MYFAYLHTRLDTNEIFYVGIGKKDTKYKTECKSRYSRAYVKKSRNNFWLNIVAKTSYSVQIIFQCESLEEIKQKEIELIKFYGRRDLGLGTLVNLTDGGDGLNHSAARAALLSKLHKERVRRQFTIEEKKTLSDSLKKFFEDPENIKRRSEQSLEYFKTHDHYGLGLHRSENTKNKISISLCEKYGKPVIQYDINGILINEYPSTGVAERATGCRKDLIRHCANNKFKQTKGFIWKWK